MSTLSILAAVILIYILFLYSEISWNDVKNNLVSFPKLSFFAFFGVTAIHLIVGARKWQLLVENTGNQRNAKAGFLFYLTSVSAGAFFGKFIPIQVSNIIVGGLSLKLSGAKTVSKGAVTSFAAQILDTFIVLVFFLPSTLILLGRIETRMWLALISVSLVVGFIIVVHGSDRLANASLWILRKLGGGRLKSIQDKIKKTAVMGLLDPSLLSRLFFLSVLRFTLLSLRTMIVLKAINIDINISQAFSIASLTQLTLVVALTPGNIGLQEWTWTGLLVYIGVPFDLAANFAIISRILALCSVSVFLLSTGIPFLFFNNMNNKREKDSIAP